MGSMTNHPNRSRRIGPAANPTPDEIRAARKLSGLTQREAAALIYATQSAWEDWEQGRRRMHRGLFELFRIKTGLEPAVQIMTLSSKNAASSWP